MSNCLFKALCFVGVIFQLVACSGDCNPCRRGEVDVPNLVGHAGVKLTVGEATSPKLSCLWTGLAWECSGSTGQPLAGRAGRLITTFSVVGLGSLSTYPVQVDSAASTLENGGRLDSPNSCDCEFVLYYVPDEVFERAGVQIQK
ncbi:MAG: hypothetical protein SFV15_18425 [Polyangiaceae bacterium]|nr:hypothetical protein [Polyangiaceae bacterium]